MAGLVVAFGVGVRHEEPNETGISHFLEHLLCTGTTSYPSPLALKDATGSLGGYTNAHTGVEWTYFETGLLVERLDTALAVVAEQLQSSLITEEEIEKQKKIVQLELQGYIDTSAQFVTRSMSSLLWPGQPLGSSDKDCIGNLKNMSKDLVRSYMNKHYVAGNCVVMITGNVDHEEWVRKIERSFTQIPSGHSQTMARAIKSPGIKASVLPRKLNKLNLTLGYYAPSNHDQHRFATWRLCDVLERRLTNVIRYQKGLTYGIQVYYTPLEDAGSLKIAGSYQQGDPERVIQLIWDELERLKSEPISDEELTQSKTRIKSDLIRASENSLRLAVWYAARILDRRNPLSMEDEEKAIDAVTSSDVLKIAQEILTDHTFKIRAIGPKDDVNLIKEKYSTD